MPAKDTALRGDLNSAIPLPAKSVDVVTAFAVLEHLHRPEIFVAEIFRVLKSGSRCILTTPTPRSQPVLEFLAYRLKVISGNDVRNHKHYFGSEELRSLFREFSGLSIRTFQAGMDTLVVGRK
ncbi:MAG: methyltransferase domain-containing protein [Nitrospiraceae bacterium]|nr:methyltransferase domain-containing protein [Nitrospiraceae bacterium]